MANRKILELEATLKDTTSLAENTTEVTDLKKSLNRAMTRHEEESTRTKNQLEELQKHLDHAGECRQGRNDSPSFYRLEKRLTDKDTVIASKTSEINAMEERYVQYLEKAKMVLRQMDPRNSNSISSQEIQSLKKQLDEKDRRFKDLEVSRRRSSLGRLHIFISPAERIRENESHSRRSRETADQCVVLTRKCLAQDTDALLSLSLSRAVPFNGENSKNV